MAERASSRRTSKLPPAEDREVRSLSPEARRRAARENRDADHAGLRGALVRRVGPGTRAFEVMKRIAVGTYQDGFIHAGNLAYLSMLAIFPFFILGAAIFQLVGGAETSQMIAAVLVTLPPTVSETIEPVAANIVEARSGWLLWLGAAVALWTVSSLVETIRDILRRAYGTKAIHAFWKYRLFSAGIILGAVVLLLLSLFAQVVIGTAQAVIDASLPQLSQLIGTLRFSRIVPALGLALSLYMLFYSLTPHEYRARRYPKWPGSLFTAVWWLGVTTALPPILSSFFAYDLTYGSLAGIIVALFFFWLVGLGLVIGAELNAALAEPEAAEDDAATDDADTGQTEE
jgi:membrane protein